MKVAERMKRVGSGDDPEIIARAQLLEHQGKDIIHFETDEPDFATHPSVFEAGIALLKPGLVKRTAPTGLPELRARIAEVEGQRRGVRFSPEQVVVTPGVRAGIFYAILALIEEGDEVLIPDPGYPAYTAAVELARGEPVFYPLREASDFHIDPEYIAARLTDHTRLMIMNSPNSPTGAVETLENLRRLVEVLHERELWVLSDEIYSHFVYHGNHASIACFDAMSERTIVVDGFSNAYNMSGWRLGYVIMPRDLVTHVGKLISNSIDCTSLISQKAGLAALETRERSIASILEEYKRRKEILVYRLNRIPGVRCVKPNGSFFVFPNVSAYGRNSKGVSDYLLEHGGVACLAGSEFGPHGEGHLRLSFATSMEKIREGVERITSTLARLRTTELKPIA